MIKILCISGSPVEDSSTDYILRELSHQISNRLNTNKAAIEFIKLNNLKLTSCIACGKIPEKNFCIYDDDISSIYNKIIECDCFLFGSPIYFDSVSAQSKILIDRCNCMRPPDYENKIIDLDFVKILTKKRPGAIVLVGGEKTWFEGARRTIAGFFKWIEVVNEGLITYGTHDFNTKGEAVKNPQVLEDINNLADQLIRKIKS